MSNSNNKKSEVLIALAGNPNVGKSTVFNNLTGMKQHTGNWAGKTVSNTIGYCEFNGVKYAFADIPGTYSLLSRSKEEEEARNFICFNKPDITVIVCDASCIIRNLNLVLQVLEITKKAILCLNLMDEAEKRGIEINIPLLEERIKIPVIPMTASKKKGLNTLMKKIEYVNNTNPEKSYVKIQYDDVLEKAIDIGINELKNHSFSDINKRFISLRLMEEKENFINTLSENINLTEEETKCCYNAMEKSLQFLEENTDENFNIGDAISKGIRKTSEYVSRGVLNSDITAYSKRDNLVDRIMTGKYTAFPVMLLLLMFILWITIKGANYPSEMLSNALFSIEDSLYKGLLYLHISNQIADMLVFGVYRVLAWVVAVMLPPMAIFFPLFTILEDLGYLPRMAFNLDSCFKKCNTCGKQSLCMAMGLGCNAVGVTGCRIIDSPRERLIAILTNSFIPCNGRFPTLIAIITMFFATRGKGSVLISSLLLSLVIVISIVTSLSASKLLGKTILKGIPEPFTMEMPPYRKPQFSKVIVRSIFDRTLFVLGRAVTVSMPAGLIIWLLAHISINGTGLLYIMCDFLDPVGNLFGLDGVILLAFIMGFPANEIVVPIMIMIYMGDTSLVNMSNLESLRNLLVSNGWTIQTAISVIIFSLMHWPCSTTCLTIKKETGSIGWTLLSILLPLAYGLTICGVINILFNIFS